MCYAQFLSVCLAHSTIFLIIEKLFKEIGPRILQRNGGYTRILKNGFRTGDKSPMAYMELVDRVEVLNQEPKELEAKQK